MMLEMMLDGTAAVHEVLCEVRRMLFDEGLWPAKDSTRVKLSRCHS